jgi:hypothetical protein
MKTIKAVLLLSVMAAIAYTGSAYAAPITGQLSISGAGSFTADDIDFAGPADINAASGAYAAALGTCDDCIITADFNSGSVNVQVYSGAHNGNNVALTLSAIDFDFDNGDVFDTLTITGSGIATLTGYDPTPAALSLTAQGTHGETGRGTFTFSATTIATPVPIPEPSTLALLGSAFLGFGWLARRREIV